MKNLFKNVMLFAAVCAMSMGFTACSSDDDDNNSGNAEEAIYKDKTYGNQAIDACDNLANQLVKANEVIGKSSLPNRKNSSIRFWLMWLTM